MKKYWLVVLFIVIVIFVWFSGFFTGWWAIRGSLGEFPEVTAATRLLVVAPHPDDEVLTSAGLIQRVLEKGGKVKIIFLTSGDGSKEAVAREAKKVDLSPQEFLDLAEERMNEAAVANQILGVNKENLIFLGFPDHTLFKVFHQNFSQGVGVSPYTHFDHVPYPEALHPGQAYLGENLLSDVVTVIMEYKPNMVVTTHPLDSHSDHKAAFSLMETARRETGSNWPIFASVVHFRNYPAQGKFTFPPKKLFGSDWVSLELSQGEEENKIRAIEAYKSQYRSPFQRPLFRGLSGKNEIFEVELNE